MTQSNGFKPSTSQPHVLVAEDLRMIYGGRQALQGLSFSLQPGRVMGFLGPNGAGKTTAIRILTTILEPTSGRFYVDGISSDHPQQIRNKIGVLPESLGFSKQTTGLECLTFFGQLYGRSAANAQQNGLKLLEDVGLGQRGKSLIGSYSRGMRQRLGIARALVNDPSVVFLDEPTLGLDPHGQQELLGLVRWVAREKNAGVILCSHALAEIESVCDDVVILNEGKIIASGTVAEVTGRSPQKVQKSIQRSGIRLHVPAEAAEAAQGVLKAIPNVVKLSATGETEGWFRVELTNQVNGDAATADYRLKNSVLEALIRADIPILVFESEGSRLQDVFFDLTEKRAAIVPANHKELA